MYNISWDTNSVDANSPAHMSGGLITNLGYIMRSSGVPNTIIEVGCYEGNSTFWMSDNLTPHNPNLKIYAIDPHEGSVDIPDDPEKVHKTFMHNLGVCKNTNVELIRKKSEDGLIELINRGVKAEVIYIDGDHRASEVLTDLVLSFKLLVTGGIIICDDTGDWQYEDKNGTRSAQMSPRLAVETFIACNWHKVRPLSIPNMGQTAFRKIC